MVRKFSSAWVTRIALPLVALLSAPAHAGTSSLGQITGVLAHTGGLFFNLESDRTSAPACATVTKRWIIDVATPQGQAMAAALLTAYMAHKRIAVTGTGDCAVWGDTETVQYFVIED